MRQRPRGSPISVVLDASPLLLRSAGVKNYVYYWARSLAEHAKPNRLQLFPFLKGPGNIAHENSVLGATDTLPRLALLYAANVCPFSGDELVHAAVGYLSRLTSSFASSKQIAADVHHLRHDLLADARDTCNEERKSFGAHRRWNLQEGGRAHRDFRMHARGCNPAARSSAGRY